MRDFAFIRRFLQINKLEQTFSIVQEVLYTIQAERYEEAVQVLTQQINSMEGQDGVVPNSGFPSHCTTSSSQAFYLALHCMAAYVYQQETEQNECSTGSFREQLIQSENCGETEIYQGFYTDDQLLCPRALTTHRLQCNGDVCNYLFETDGGRYKGEDDKYLWYDRVLYKGLGFENIEEVM